MKKDVHFGGMDIPLDEEEAKELLQMRALLVNSASLLNSRLQESGLSKKEALDCMQKELYYICLGLSI